MADDRLPTLFASLDPSSHYFSLEFFPPKTSSGFSNLQSRLARMATALRPLFVTVTWGAGGSTAAKSLELAEVCQRQLGLTTVLHLTCTNMKRRAVDDALESAKELGIRNILALRGDPPREEYKEPDESPTAGTDSNEEFVWAVDLVRYIRRKHGDYFAIGVAGYPEGHSDESNPEQGKQSVEHDLPYLAKKVAAGADFIMTQLTYDIEAYRDYETRLREYPDSNGKKLFEKIPIIPGMMPVQSYQIVRRITKLSHAKMPDDIWKRIEAVKADDDEVKKVGVDILTELVEQIKSLPQPEGVPRGFHFYTLNLERAVTLIIERTGLIQPISEARSAESSDSEVIVDDLQQDVQAGSDTRKASLNGEYIQTQGPAVPRRRTSSVNAQPHNRFIMDRASHSPAQSKHSSRSDTDPSRGLVAQHQAADRGTGIPASEPTRQHNLMISKGQGALGREAAVFDDFPNGRFGNSASPAFGEIDGYGPSLKCGPRTARQLWGHPKSRQAITDLFRRHVMGELGAVPWSDEVDVDVTTSGALRAETNVIRTELVDLITKREYWTLASQPAVDGARSEDSIFGWGPPGEGFVFQKAFVEFFCSKEEWEQRLKPLLLKIAPEEVSWMKTDVNGVFEASPVSKGRAQKDQEQPQAVTWGSFRNREIVSPTIIEPESFRTWAEEAYAIWREWRRCFPQGSEEEKLLDRMRTDNVIINCVGQNYKGGHTAQGGRLWKILMGGDVGEAGR